MLKNLSLVAAMLLVLFSCEEETLDVQPEPEVELRAGVYTSGTNNGYFYSLYREGGSGNISFPNANQWAGNFAVSWNNVQDIVGGKGWSRGSGRTINFNIGSLSGGYDFVGVYGWTVSPLIEYYVCEKGYGINGSQYVNRITSDGHSYDFWRNQRINAPSIQGTKTFWQYIDRYGRAATNANRKVTMSNHINNWKNNGGKGFGSHDYQVFGVEAFSGKSGYINATIW